MKVIECPRDAMQGWPDLIPTEKKVAYLNQLLKIGFDTLDFGSFVSHRAIPQMKDTPEILQQLKLENTNTRLLAIVANTRGAKDAIAFEEISYLGFPLSLSETFQRYNTNKSIALALETVQEIQNLCLKHNKTLVTYLSMGFGNPYGDPYNTDIVGDFAENLSRWDIRIISLADTIGVSSPDNIRHLFSRLIPAFPDIEFGAHLHSTPDTAKEKIKAAYLSGCQRFDGTLKGFGGCPMAREELVGNIPTETILEYLEEQGVQTPVQESEFHKALEMAPLIFRS